MKREAENVDARCLPNNLEAERSVLGAIVIDNAAYDVVAQALHADDFFRDSHQRIFRAMGQLIEKRTRIDFVTLKEELARKGELEECGGPAYIASLVDGVPHSTNSRHYAVIVREKAALRQLVFAANRILTDAYAAEEPSSDIVQRADIALLDVQKAHVSGRMNSLSAGATGLFNDCAFRYEHRGQLRGIDTGFASLNVQTNGWQAGDLIIIAARPSIGKTTFVMNTAVAAARVGKRVALFSMEMREQQLHYRLLSSLSGVACSRLLSGQASESESAALASAFQTMHDLPIAIDDQARQTVQEIRAACRRMRAEGGLDLVVIDYVQLMSGSVNRKGATRTEELSDISRRLKLLGDELAAPILTLSQLRRLERHRAPQLDDLRDCGAFEQDSDVVGFLHRANHRAGGVTKLILAKQRNGPTGTINLTLDRDTLTFTDAGEATADDEASADTGKDAAPADESQGLFQRRARRWQA